MPNYDWVARHEYDRVVRECNELKHTNACFKAEYEHERGLAQKYFEQAAALQRDRNMAEDKYGEAKSRLKERYAELEKLRKENESMRNNLRDKRTDYTNLMSECAMLKKMKDDFCIEACHLNSALRARNALLQIMFLATGLHDCMLQEMFNCHFHTSEASFDEDLTRCMIQYCINNNSTIIDTLTGYRFDIADRLAKAIEVRNIYGMPRKQDAHDTLTPEKKPICDARHVADKKKKDVRAKPEQSQRRAKRGKAKPHQKGKCYRRSRFSRRWLHTLSLCQTK